jgi:hypothetical protein
MNLKETVLNGRDWIHLAQGRDHWKVLMKFRFP